LQNKNQKNLEETENRHSLFVADLQAKHRQLLEQTEAKYEA